MFEESLADAVERFADATQDASDAELDREWAWGAYDSEGVRFSFFRTYEELRELAAETASARVAHGLPMSPAQRILAQYHLAYRDLQAALVGIGDDVVLQAPAEGEWPVRQVVAHIVGAELGFYGVVRYALDRHSSGDGRPAEIPEEAWDSLVGETDESFRALMDSSLTHLRTYHRALHERVLGEFAGISEAEVALDSFYWEGTGMSLRFRLHRFDSHLRQHTIQIDKSLEALGHSPGEARRLLRLVYAALAEAEGVAIGAWDVGQEERQEAALGIAARAGEIAQILSG